MSSGGTILDSIKRQRSNREMQKWLRKKYADKMKAYLKPSGKIFNPAFQQNLTKAELQAIKKEIRAEVKRANIISWMYTLLVIAIIVIIVSVVSSL